MTPDIPPIRMFMTLLPVVVGREQSITFAKQLMKENGVRHLPVVDALGEVVGVLSQRALKLIEQRWDLDDHLLTVDVLAHHDVYTVSPESPLDEVCATMAEHRYGSAIVVEAGRPIGIFTTTDACAALASLARVRAV